MVRAVATVAPDRVCNFPAARGTTPVFPAPIHPPANAACWPVIPPDHWRGDNAFARRDSPQRPVPRVAPVVPRNARKTPCGNNPALHPTPATRYTTDITWCVVQNCRWARNVSCKNAKFNPLEEEFSLPTVIVLLCFQARTFLDYI